MIIFIRISIIAIRRLFKGVVVVISVLVVCVAVSTNATLIAGSQSYMMARIESFP